MFYFKVARFLSIPQQLPFYARGSDAWAFWLRSGDLDDLNVCARNLHSKIFIASNNSRPRTTLQRVDINFFLLLLLLWDIFICPLRAREGNPRKLCRGTGWDRSRPPSGPRRRCGPTDVRMVYLWGHRRCCHFCLLSKPPSRQGICLQIIFHSQSEIFEE